MTSAYLPTILPLEFLGVKLDYVVGFVLIALLATAAMNYIAEKYLP